MWFSLFAIVLILAMTFFQGLQGLFSALITCILTVLAAALAFGLYEDLYFGQLIRYQPDHGRSIALVGIFIISLLVLRGLFDAIIKGNMHFPLYVDRIGGGVVGFVSALIAVGVLAVGVQMLPFGTSFLGFSRYELVDEQERAVAPPEDADQEAIRTFRSRIDYRTVKHRRRSLAGFFNPDGFAAGIASHLSANALQGRNQLSAVYPDLLGSIYNAQSAHFNASRIAVPADSLRVEAWWFMPNKSPIDSLHDRVPVETPEGQSKSGQRGHGSTLVRLERIKTEASAGPEQRYIVVRVNLNSEARDEDNHHRFTTEQVRLVARVGKPGEVREFFLAGINHAFQTANSHDQAQPRWVKLYRGESIARQNESGGLNLDWVFAVPQTPDFTPLFVEYKQNARAALSAAQDKSNEPQVPTPLKPPARKAKPGEEAQPQEPAPEPFDNKPSADASPSPQPQPSTPRPGSPQPSTPRQGDRMQDRVSGIGPTREGIFSTRLPFTLTDYGASSLELGGSVLRGGHVWANLDDNWQPLSGSRGPIETFEEPSGMKLLQVSVEKLQPASWIGGIMGTAIDNIQDFYLVDEGGKKFMPVGMYAVAMAGGRPTIEIRFLDDIARGMARLPKFERIRPRDLQGDYALFFLFHLPPGTRAVQIHTGRTNVDLRDFNLVAPN